MATATRLVVKRNDLPKVRDRLKPAASALVSESGDRIVTGARQKVRVDTGALRDSTRKEMEPGALSCRVTSFGDRATGEAYAAPNEFGTAHMSAQPYMRPAAEEEVPRIGNAWKALEDGIT